jgi:hypothetical protein
MLMKANRGVRIYIPYACLLGLLALGFGLESWNQYLQHRNSIKFDIPYLMIGSTTVSSMLISVAVLLVFWIVMRQRSFWIGVTYLVVGLYLCLNPVLFLVGLSLDRLWGGFYPQVLSIGSAFSWACSGTAMIGLLSLVLSIPGRKQKKDENGGKNPGLS